MCSSWDDLPSLNTQQFSNNIKTLRQLCEESCVNNAFSIFIEQVSFTCMFTKGTLLELHIPAYIMLNKFFNVSAVREKHKKLTLI